jgi:hypothetical protein
MTPRDSLQLVLHGAIFLMIGMLVGFPLTEAVTSGDPNRSAHQWGVLHDTFLVFGVILLAVGAVWQRLVLTARSGAVLLWSLVGSCYVSAVVMIVGAVTGVQGLSPSDAFSALLFAGFAVSLVGFLLGGWLLIWGAYAAWRAACARASLSS